MKTLFALCFCLSLTFATLTIPLQSISVVEQDANQHEQSIDDIYVAEAEFRHISSGNKYAQEYVIFDTFSDINYLITSSVKYGGVPVDKNALECSTCESGQTQTGTYSVLGGKAKLQGGILKTEVEIEMKDSVEETQTQQKLCVPSTVDASTTATNVKIFQQSNAGVSLGRTSSSYISNLQKNNKLVQSDQFSLYIHGDIAQLNIGGIQEYFVEPGSVAQAIRTNTSKDWAVTVIGIKTKNGSQLRKASDTLVAHFDTTSKYIYVPFFSGNPAEPAHYYFMDGKELPCFQPKDNLQNKYSYVCEAEKFQGYETYNNIVFTFKGVDDKSSVEVVLEPVDYIQEREDGKYELLFRFTQSPQDTNAFYFGTSFFNKYYPTFNNDIGQIILNKKFEVTVPENGLYLSEGARITFAVLGSLLVVCSVVLLFAILKRVKLDDQPEFQQQGNPMYSVYQQPASYTASVRNSQYQPAVATSVYQPGQNIVVNSQLLRQSQSPITQIRSSQVRNSQNIAIRPNY